MNPAHERLFGYTCEESLGHDMLQLAQSENNKSELVDGIRTMLKKAKVREKTIDYLQ